MKMSIRAKINSFLVFRKSSSHPLDGPMQRWLHKKGSQTEFTPEELNGMTKQEKLAWIMARSNGSAKQWLDSPRPVQPSPQIIDEPLDVNVDEEPDSDGFEGMDVLNLPPRGAPLRQVSPLPAQAQEAVAPNGGGNYSSVLPEFSTSAQKGFAARTIENARDSDVTIDFSAQLSGSGGANGLTRDAARRAGKPYVQIPIRTDGSVDIDGAVNNIVSTIIKTGNPSVTLNIAGHGLSTIAKYQKRNLSSQSDADRVTLEVISRVKQQLEAKNFGIKKIRTGGQSGFDESGIMAASRLGIPSLVHAPADWRYLDREGRSYTNEENFKERFHAIHLPSDVREKFDELKDNDRRAFINTLSSLFKTYDPSISQSRPFVERQIDKLLRILKIDDSAVNRTVESLFEAINNGQASENYSANPNASGEPTGYIDQPSGSVSPRIEEPDSDGFEGMDVLNLPPRGAPLRQVSPYDDPYDDLDVMPPDAGEEPPDADEEPPDAELSPDYRNVVTAVAPSNPNFPVVPAGMGFGGKRGVRIAPLVRPPAETTEEPPAVPTIEWTPKKIASNALDKYHYSLLSPEAQAIARRVQQQLHVIPEDEWSSGQRLLHQKRDEYYQERMRLLDSLHPEYIGQNFSTRTPAPEAVASLDGRLEAFGHDPLLHHARVEHAIRTKSWGLTRTHDDDFHGPSGAFAPDPYPHDPIDEIEI